MKSNRIRRTISSDNVRAHGGDELAALDVSIDLADLTEEIVETTVISHYCSKSLPEEAAHHHDLGR